MTLTYDLDAMAIKELLNMCRTLRTYVLRHSFYSFEFLYPDGKHFFKIIQFSMQCSIYLFNNREMNFQ